MTSHSFFMSSKEEVKDYLEIEAALKIGIRNKLRSTFFMYYVPVHDPRLADFHYNTATIFQKCLQIIASAEFSADDVALWLHEAGFSFFDYGEMDFEWMLKKA